MTLVDREVGSNFQLNVLSEGKILDNEVQATEKGDSTADAIAAVVIVLVFVAVCIYWVAGQ